MKDAMKDIDEKIREALRKEDAELLEHYRGEASIHEMVIEVFRGRHRWLNVFILIMSWVIFGLLVVAGRQFFLAESTQAMIAWATGLLCGVMWLVLMKIWFWLEIHKNSITREIKRLELQLANLSRKLGAEK